MYKPKHLLTHCDYLLLNPPIPTTFTLRNKAYQKFDNTNSIRFNIFIWKYSTEVCNLQCYCNIARLLQYCNNACNISEMIYTVIRNVQALIWIVFEIFHLSDSSAIYKFSKKKRKERIIGAFQPHFSYKLDPIEYFSLIADLESAQKKL